MSDDWKKQLENAVQCPICIQECKDPRALPTCLHTFCADCLRTDVLKKRETHDAIYYPCPICRAECEVSQRHDPLESQFPVNFLVKTLVGIYRGSQKSRVTHHTNTGSAATCNVHRREIQNYCAQCDEVICLKCLKQKCRHHLDDVHDLEGTRDLVKKMVRGTKTQIREISEQIQQTDEAYEQTLASMKESHVAIGVFVKELVKVLVQNSEEFRKSVGSKFESSLHEMKTHRNQLQQIADPLKTTISNKEQVLPKASLEEVVKFKKELDTLQCEPYTKQVRPLTGVFFPQTALIETMHTIAMSLGDTKFDKMVAEFSVIRGAGGSGGDGGGITGLAVTRCGDVICVDEFGMRKFSKDGDKLRDYEGLNSPFDCFVTNGDDVVVSDRSGQIVTFSANGFRASVGVSCRPMGIALNSQHRYVTVTSGSQDETCLRISNEDDEEFSLVPCKNRVTSVFQNPWNVKTNSNDDIFVTDWKMNTLYIFDARGSWKKTYTPQRREENLSSPRGLAVDANDCIYVCDQRNNRIVVLTPGGDFSHELYADDGTLTSPMSVAVDDVNNRIIVGQEDYTIKIFEM